MVRYQDVIVKELSNAVYDVLYRCIDNAYIPAAYVEALQQLIDDSIYFLERDEKDFMEGRKNYLDKIREFWCLNAYLETTRLVNLPVTDDMVSILIELYTILKTAYHANSSKHLLDVLASCYLFNPDIKGFLDAVQAFYRHHYH